MTNKRTYLDIRWILTIKQQELKDFKVINSSYHNCGFKREIPEALYVMIQTIFKHTRPIGINFLTISTEKKTCFTQFTKGIYWNRSWAASGFFHMCTQSIKLFTFLMFEKGNVSNKQKMNGNYFHQVLRQNLKWFLS